MSELVRCDCCGLTKEKREIGCPKHIDIKVTSLDVGRSDRRFVGHLCGECYNKLLNEIEKTFRYMGELK